MTSKLETLRDISRAVGRQAGLDGKRKALKRKNVLLEDTKNFNGEDQVKRKKRKQFIQREDEGFVPLVEIRDPSLCAETVASDKTHTPGVQCQPSENIFPSDIVRCTKDGHLFAREYLQPILTSLDSGEKNSAELLPNPNYFNKQINLRPRMRTILFSWLVEVHMKFELREVIL